MANDLAIRAILSAEISAFTKGMQQASRSVTQFGRDAEVGFARATTASKGFQAFMKKGIGVAGIGAGLAVDLLGGDTRAGRAASAITNVAGQAALGGAVGGPWAAAGFGLAAAVKEMRNLNEESRKHAENREKAAKAAIQEARATSLQVQEEFKRLRRQVVGDQSDQPSTPLGILRQLESEQQHAMNRFETLLDIGASRKVLFNVTDEAHRALVESRKVANFIGFQALTGVAQRMGVGALQDIRGGVMGRAESLFAPHRQAVNTFFMRAKEGFTELVDIVTQWKADVKATAAASRELAKGPVGRAADQIDRLNEAWRQKRITGEQLLLSALEVRRPLVEEAEQLLLRAPGGPVRGTQEAFAEIDRILARDKAEENAERILNEQLDLMKQLAKDIGQEVLRGITINRPLPAQF